MENGVETKYTFDWTKKEACLVIMALCEFSKPAEDFLNGLNAKKCHAATIMAHVEGHLERAVNTIRDVNKLLVQLTSIVEDLKERDELIEECNQALSLVDDWQTLMKKLDENARVTRL